MEETKKIEMKGSPKQIAWANDIVDKAIKTSKSSKEKEIQRLIDIEAQAKGIESVKNSMRIQKAFFEKIRESGDSALIIKKRHVIESMANNFCGDYLSKILGRKGIETGSTLIIKENAVKTNYTGRIEEKVSDSVIDLIATELANRLMNSEIR